MNVFCVISSCVVLRRQKVKWCDSIFPRAHMFGLRMRRLPQTSPRDSHPDGSFLCWYTDFRFISQNSQVHEPHMHTHNRDEVGGAFGAAGQLGTRQGLVLLLTLSLSLSPPLLSHTITNTHTNAHTQLHTMARDCSRYPFLYGSEVTPPSPSPCFSSCGGKLIFIKSIRPVYVTLNGKNCVMLRGVMR